MAKHNYDELLTRHQADRPRRISNAQAIRDVLEPYLRPRSFADIGCGVGWLARAYADAGADVLGLDGPWIAEMTLEIPSEQVQVFDLKDPLRLDRRFDLVACLEVAEHLPPERGQDLIRELCSLSDVVLFSAAIPNQGGFGHLNEQWQDYWARSFDENGYRCFDVLCPKFAANEEMYFWFRQNLLLFAKPDTAVAEALEPFAISPDAARLILPSEHEKILRRQRKRLQKRFDKKLAAATKTIP